MSHDMAHDTRSLSNFTFQPLLANQTASLPAPQPMSMHVRGSLGEKESGGGRRRVFATYKTKYIRLERGTKHSTNPDRVVPRVVDMAQDGIQG